MAGRAYNPDAWEPEAHGTFATPSKEIIQKWNEEKFTKVLNHFKYEQMYDIYAGIEDELFEGAIDSHCHIYPDYVPRSIDMIQYAIDASKAKMRALVFKEHFFTNVHAAWAVQYIVDDLVRRGELDHAIKVFGTINVAFSHHPDQIRLISKYPNLGAIFFYTFTGWPEPARRKVGPVLPITDDKGKLLPEVKEILQIAAENKIPIMTGHKSPERNMALVKGCHEVGARVLVTHAHLNVVGCGGIENAREMVRLGAYLEIGATHWLPSIYFPCQDPNVPNEFIKEVGPENIIINTDYGQLLQMHPLEGFKLYVRGLLHAGFSKADIKTMIATNPSKLLYLED
jgi:hypothetical protein